MVLGFEIIDVIDNIEWDILYDIIWDMVVRSGVIVLKMCL